MSLSSRNISSAPSRGPRKLISAENAAVMQRFCSIGSNCEFGFAQRWAGAEPLDLLRWAFSPLPVLLALLQNRFAGIGDGLTLWVDPANSQYVVINPTYGFRWHAWVREGEISPERLLQREGARLSRLAEMLIETLEQSERTFVRIVVGRESLKDANTILTALRAYGNATLLAVKADQSRAGTVVANADGLLVGCIDKFERTVQLTHTDVWLTLCRNALALSEGVTG
jgi:hypothetical protein